MESFFGLFNPDSENESWDPTPLSPLPEILPPEAEEGNIEYKLKLLNPSKSRLEHLITQLKWRLREGQGEAIYAIGVTDSGQSIGITPHEMNQSLRTLYVMATELGADITTLRERHIDHSDKVVTELLVRKVPDDQHSIELRVAVLGSSDVGKSTLLGVLTQGENDNGHGSARLNVFRHLHEIQSGRTSSISQEILGFDSDGLPLNYNRCRTAEKICENATKLITFIDLAGHQKYMKTTVFGLTGQSPHFAMLVVSAVSGMSGTITQHLSIALEVGIPIVVVINKIDLSSPTCLKKNVSSLETILKGPGCEKVPLQVKTSDDALTAAKALVAEQVVPIFFVSCVSGDGLELLYRFLNVLPSIGTLKEKEKLMQLPPEYQIDETFQVPGVGLVVSGLLAKGTIREGDRLHAGPFENGEFFPVKVISLHRHRVPSRIVRACEAATLAIGCSSELQVRKGMVLVIPKDVSPTCFYFQARIKIVFHSTAIYPGFQGSAFINNIRQTVKVIGIMNKRGLSTNDSSSVIFQFVQRPEYVNPGSKLLFQMGETRAVGHVTQVFCMEDGQPIRTDIQ